MKRIQQILRSGFVAAILFISCSAISFGQSFEGVIHYKFGEMSQDGMALKYMINNSKMRIELEGSGMMKGASILFFPQKNNAIVLIDRMKAYMKLDMNQGRSSSYAQKWKGSSLKKTDITKTIAGHSCEIWKITASNGDQTTLCMAQGMGSFMMSTKMMGGQNTPAWVQQIKGKNYMPLKVMTQTDGNKTVSMIATKIVEKQLDDNLFRIPDSYRDMSAMMQQMKNMRNH